MRLSKITVFFAAAAVVFATEPSCSTSVRCCESNGPAGILEVIKAFNLLGGLIIPLLTPVWLTCPVLIGETCDGNTVCCENVASNGGIAVGCINVIV